MPGSNWSNIRTPKQLKTWILQQAQYLRRNGHSKLASEWEARASKMPSKMSKEAINGVLLSASWKLEEIKKKK